MQISDEKHWKELLEKDPELKKLAVKAGIENNFKRVQELEGCFAWNFGKDVIKSEDESDFALYMFCMTDNGEMDEVFQQRAQAARRAGISINDL